jgi:hypothetical protein
MQDPDGEAALDAKRSRIKVGAIIQLFGGRDNALLCLFGNGVRRLGLVHDQRNRRRRETQVLRQGLQTDASSFVFPRIRLEHGNPELNPPGLGKKSTLFHGGETRQNEKILSLHCLDQLQWP